MTALLPFRRLASSVWLFVAVAAVVGLLVVGHAAGLRWDPLGLAGRRARTAEQRAATHASDAAARRLELEGVAAQGRRLDDHHQRALETARITAAAEAEARSAHDANISLDPARAGRLRAHDRELCRIHPASCFSAAPPGP